MAVASQPLIEIGDDPRVEELFFLHLLGYLFICLCSLEHLGFQLLQLLGHLEVPFELDLVVFLKVFVGGAGALVELVVRVV